LLNGGTLDPLKEKENNRAKFMQTGRGRRQDHASRGNSDRFREWDDREDKVLFAQRRDARHGADEALIVENEAED